MQLHKRSGRIQQTIIKRIAQSLTIATLLGVSVSPASAETENLEENFIAKMVDYPTLYSRILVERNFDWAHSVKEYLGDSEVEFILVGVAHPAGEKSLLSILEKEGYTIEQVIASN